MTDESLVKLERDTYKDFATMNLENGLVPDNTNRTHRVRLPSLALP